MRARVRTTTLGFLAASALGVGLFFGCGSARPPAEEETVPTPKSTASTGPATIGGNADAGSSNQPPGCGAQSDGTYCGCEDVPLYGDAPNIYFLLDRSGSMSEDDKWNEVREVVAEIMRSLGPRANFGASVFPGPSDSDSCAPGIEILPVTAGDPPSAGTNGPAVSQLISVTESAELQPNGGTPTAAALNALVSRLSTVNGKTFVIVATDGAPNCDFDPNQSCDATQCQLNIESGAPGCSPTSANCCTGENNIYCNDAKPTLNAITALKSAGYLTYVVGLPGANAPAYATLLDGMADAGGTAQPTEPHYYAVQAGGSDAILAALRKIAAQITGTCVFTLKSAPSDPSLVNVYLDDVVLPFEPVNGWTISGSTVTLVGSACSNVMNGNVLDVRIVTGCPTVLPK